MRRAMITSLLMTALVMSAGLVVADTEVSVTGEVRARSELSDITFHTENKLQRVTYLRSRVNIEALKDGNATAFVQLQDSRLLGGMNNDGAWASGGTAGGENVDVHQAYIQIDKIWWDGFGAKIGRFEVNFGNERVFGGVGWSNIGRSWEGAMKWYGTDQMKMTGFVLKRQERNQSTENADFDVYGLYYSNKKLHFDLFGVYEYDATAGGDNIAGVKRMSFGTYYTRKHKNMDYTFNAVLQTGNIGVAADPGDSVGSEVDISAYMLAFEAGYTFDKESKPRLAVGIDLTSGSDATDTDIKTYSNLYPTAHKFQGYMDYFVNTSGTAYAAAGLMDIYLRGKCNFKPDWWMFLDWHFFKTSADYLWDDDANGATPAVATSDVGMEFDLTIKTKSVAGVGLACGASYFIAKDSFSQSMTGDTDNDPGFWAYTQATVGF